MTIFKSCLVCDECFTKVELLFFWFLEWVTTISIVIRALLANAATTRPHHNTINHPHIKSQAF